jgi:long-chain acyl-CoA synthetase
MIVLTNGKKAFPEEIEFLIAHIPVSRESIVWGESSSRGAVDICAKLVLDPDSLPQETAGDMEKISVYMNQQISEINRQMPPYKAIKYFVLSETDLVQDHNAESQTSNGGMISFTSGWKRSPVICAH